MIWKLTFTAVGRIHVHTHMNFTVDQFLPKIRQNDLDTKKKKKTLPEGETERKTGRKREEAVEMKTERGNV